MSRVGVFYNVLLLLLMYCCVESCVQKNIQERVPEMLEPGYVVSKVNLEDCSVKSLELTCSDPDFTVQTDGIIKTVSATMVPADGKSFWIIVQDNEGHSWFVAVNLFPIRQVSKDTVLKRAKRRWSPPPFSVKENDVGPFPKNMEMIASDTSVNYSLYYVIKGPGVDLTPAGLFSVIPNNGMLRVHQSIDREQYPKIVFMAHARNTITNAETDDPLPITVIIEDVNDNAPQFSGSLNFAVSEQCPMGTTIGKVNATDKDEPGTLHTKIAFFLLNHQNLFRIDRSTGVITATTNTLDRETAEKYVLDLEIKDMDGAAGGLSTRGSAVVSLNDINDNPPTFTQPLYKANALENKVDVLVLRIPVEDKDLKNTPNWRAVYEITKGNESGNFLIKTDPATNEGLLYVTKPLDYEKQPKVNLEVMARNEVPLVGTTSSWQKASVEISVDDVDEGPEFNPNILELRVKENVPNGTLIGTYTANDPETKDSKNIRYYKLTDRGNWINLGEANGELKTAMTIDRESPLVVNNTYNITVKAVDSSLKTGTGTVLIYIEDVNDNSPMITKPDMVLCSKDGAKGSVRIEAKDLDQKPYADPFTFELGKASTAQWKLTGATGTSALLQPTSELPNGIYQVPILVKDLQGFGTEQMMTVRVCDCVRDGECAAKRLATTFGVWGILAMLLGLLLLLLLCLLCICACTTKGEKLAMADDAVPNGMLLKSNFEAPGEEVKDALLMMPSSGVDVMDMSKGMGTMDNQTILSTGGFGEKTYGRGIYHNNMQGLMTANTLSSGQYSTGMYGNTFKKYSTMSTMDGWRESGMLLDTKLGYFGEEADTRFADDILRPYGYEGVGSPAGSVGCCSILGEQESLDFLDSLGPKFKPLADVCTSKSQRGGK